MNFAIGKDEIVKSKFWNNNDIRGCLDVLANFSMPKGYDPENSGKNVQSTLFPILKGLNPDWKKEVPLRKDVQDKADLYLRSTVNGKNITIVIEIDATRADQVAKKFVSRAALVDTDVFVYIAFTYPDSTENYNETYKYLKYIKDLCAPLKIGTKNREIYFCGFMPGDSDNSSAYTKYIEHVKGMPDRIEKWANNSKQLNSIIVRSFLKKAVEYSVELEVLKKECIANGISEKQFKDNFCQMLNFYKHGHGYIFDVNLGQVTLSDISRNLVLKYESRFRSNA